MNQLVERIEIKEGHSLNSETKMSIYFVVFIYLSELLLCDYCTHAERREFEFIFDWYALW